MASIGYYKHCKINSLCVSCGKSHNTGRTNCYDCSQKASNSWARRYNKRLGEKVCVNCGSAISTNKRLCDTCVAKKSISSKRYKNKWKEAGRCNRCGGEKLESILICLDCWYKIVAYGRTKNHVSVNDLKDILEVQNYKCVYTGRILIPGINASLDHIIPLNRDGVNEKGNLQWVDVRINAMKCDYTHEEFLDIIHEMVRLL